MLIDFSSRPPHPDFSPPAPHLQNYRRVYQASEGRSAASDAAPQQRRALDLAQTKPQCPTVRMAL